MSRAAVTVSSCLYSVGHVAAPETARIAWFTIRKLTHRVCGNTVQGFTIMDSSRHCEQRPVLLLSGIPWNF